MNEKLFQFMNSICLIVSNMLYRHTTQNWIKHEHYLINKLLKFKKLVYQKKIDFH